MISLREIKIAVIGLGYVGLPLAAEFSKCFNTVGFDVDEKRIDELRRGLDRTREIENLAVINTQRIIYTNNIDDIKDCNVYIIAVPTPIDRQNHPDLTLLRKASRMVGKILTRDDVVIYESTVYPGCTEEQCIPLLEEASNLKYNTDFFVGYSPERINPGDKIHCLSKIIKVTSGSTPEIASFVDDLYREIIEAGTYKASSIKVAEAAKAIENTQRDINIALMNELAMIFHRLNIDVKEVINAAATKWNFLNFSPGLVGGHCIGVDPYYLTYKAQEVGYHPEMILSGRRINDNMGYYVAERTIKLMLAHDIQINQASVLILGLAFKENCPDLRNTKVVNIIDGLKEYQVRTYIYDPVVDQEEAKNAFGLEPLNSIDYINYDAIVLAVAHDDLIAMLVRDQEKLKQLGKKQVIFDVKSCLPFKVSARL